MRKSCTNNYHAYLNFSCHIWSDRRYKPSFPCLKLLVYPLPPTSFSAQQAQQMEKLQQLHNTENSLLCLPSREEIKWLHPVDNSSSPAPDHTSLCIWPSLTSRNKTQVSVCHAMGLIYHLCRISQIQCAHVQGPTWSSRVIWDDYRYQDDWSREKGVSWVRFTVWFAVRPVPLISQLLLASFRREAAVWGMVKGRALSWDCSEMFYSGCLSSKEHFPLRLNYPDSVYSKHRRQDSCISSF